MWAIFDDEPQTSMFLNPTGKLTVYKSEKLRLNVGDVAVTGAFSIQTVC